jgi:hypothetical protein
VIARLQPAPGDVVTREMLDGAPPAMRRYLTWTGVVGRPIPGSMALRQTGRIRPDNDKPWWRFSAEESFLMGLPAFRWLAHVRMAGLPLLRVSDSYIAGRGRTQVRLARVLTVADHRGSEINEAALLRYLSEMVWFPAAFLLGNVDRRQIGRNAAHVTIRDAGLSVTGTFRFDDVGRPLGFTALRSRDLGGNRFHADPWIAAFTAYGELNGVRVPIEGWSGYRLPSGILRYIELRVEPDLSPREQCRTPLPSSRTSGKAEPEARRTGGPR